MLMENCPMLRCSCWRYCFLAITPLIAALPPAGAQATRHTTMVAANPLGIPFDIFQLEIEHQVGTGTTLGLLGSDTEIEDVERATVDLKFRYYPAEEVFNRFSAGLSLGYTHFSSLVYSPTTFYPGGSSTPQPTRQTLNAPTLGLLVEYNWLQGKTQRFVLGTGG